MLHTYGDPDNPYWLVIGNTIAGMEDGKPLVPWVEAECGLCGTILIEMPEDIDYTDTTCIPLLADLHIQAAHT